MKGELWQRAKQFLFDAAERTLVAHFRYRLIDTAKDSFACEWIDVGGTFK